MGAKKKRQERSWYHRQHVSQSGSANRHGEKAKHEGQLAGVTLHNSSNCNNVNPPAVQLISNADELRNKSVVKTDQCTNLIVSHLFPNNFPNHSSLWRSRNDNITGVCRNKNSLSLVKVLILLVILASSSVIVESVCVWQGGGGFKVACGFRQSGLFRLRSIGGIKGYVGAGFTIGDENGFKDSLTNTEQQQQQPQSGPYVIPNNVHSQRSLSSGPSAQYSQNYEHFVPIPSGDPNLQRQQKMHYLQTIQNQMNVEHQSIQLQAADQQSQKMLEQQMYVQGGILPSPSPTSKVKRAGLTKRASLWNWPNIFGRGKGGSANNSKKKPKHREFDGPPPSRRGHPMKNNNARWDRPPRKKPSGPPPGRREERFHDQHGGNGRRGPKFNVHSRPQHEKVSDSFLGHMKNPFAHLQDNFIGKSHSQEVRRGGNFHEHANDNANFGSIPQQHHQNFRPHVTMEGNLNKQTNLNKVPQTLMMPPGGPLVSENLPKFKKIPNNVKVEDDEDDIRQGSEFAMKNQHQHQYPPVDRMMHNAQDELNSRDVYNSPGSGERRRLHENDPAGLKMLKRTENFGTIFHLVNPDGSPVNMQFEKQPIIPPGVEEYGSEQQQQQQAMMGSDLSVVAGIPQGHQPMLGSDSLAVSELDSPLATAVYDPNIFPDIYFTTTEKLKNPDLSLLGGVNYGLSQELLDNPLLFGLGENQIKRILGGMSSEKSESSITTGKSNELSNSTPVDGEIVITRRKMRRKKKFRTQDSETDTIGPDIHPTPKKKRKGRRKKYKLQKMKINEIFTGSTERMGLAAVDAEEQASTEAELLTPIVPLTTTPSPSERPTVPFVASNENKVVKSSEKVLVKKKPTEKYGFSGENFQSTSFSLPSIEELRSPILASLEVSEGVSNENKVDTNAGSTNPPNRTSTEETTTAVPFSFSTFGYYDALSNKNDDDDDDYDFSGPSGPGDYFRSAYDPRYPPDHEKNRGRNMTKFIRPRMKGKNQNQNQLPTTTTTNSPFILYDMTGNRTQSRFSSKFHKDSSPFRLDGDDEPNRGGDAYGTRHNPHPLYSNNNQGLQGVVGTSAHHHHPGQLDTNDNGVYVKFDSNEWTGHSQKSNNQPSSDPISKHYNRTSLNSGYYGASGPSREYGHSQSVELPWEVRLKGQASSTQAPSPMYPGFNDNASSRFVKPSSSSSQSLEHTFFGAHVFGPSRQTQQQSSEDKQKQKLHKNLFGGSSADVSDLGNWASPNFWGNVQEADRYGPSADFDAQNNNLKRLLNFDSANGLKEMKPADLSSSPTPLPMPSPSPPQGTMEYDDYFLSPSTPGSRWGKQRRRNKGRPTTAMPSTTVTLTIPSSTPSPAKWLAVMSNEVDVPPEYYDNVNLPPSLLAKGGEGKKSGVEIKFRSGEERDPEEEESRQVNTTHLEDSSHFNILTGFPSSANGFPGVMVHDFDTSQGYGFGEPGGMKRDEGNSETNYFSSSGSGMHGANNNNNNNNIESPGFEPFGPPSRMDSEHSIFTGGTPVSTNSRNDFLPSAEDLGPVAPIPPSADGTGQSSDNPFKMFEKQNYPVENSGGGFVSAKHELKAMENQISRFSNVPVFLRRDDSSEMKMGGGHGPIMDHPEFSGPPTQPPSAADMANIPGFANVEMPNLEISHPDTAPSEIPQSPLSAFGPSGFPNNLREEENVFSGLPPTGLPLPPSMQHESWPSGDGNKHVDAPGPHDRPHDAPWNFNPLEHNDVELGPPNHMHPDEHHQHGSGSRPPFNPPLSGRERPMDSDEGFRGPPPHMRDGPPMPPLGNNQRHEHHDGPPWPPSGNTPRHDQDGPPRPPPGNNQRHEYDGPPRPQTAHNPRHELDSPQRRPPPHRDDHPMQPPPHRDHERPPGRHHEFPPRGPPGPPGARDHDRRPPHPEFDRDFNRDGPSRRPDGRFRDGPPRGPPSRPHDSRQPHGGMFHGPPKDDSFRFEHDRKHHKTIENLRPPPKSQYHVEKPHEHRTEHSSFSSWQDGNKDAGGRGKFPPGPHLDIPTNSNNHPDHRAYPIKYSGPHPNKHLPSHGKIPPQVFKPPHPPPTSRPSPINIFKNMLTGPFGKPNKYPPMSQPPPSSQKNQNSRMPPPPPPPSHQQQPPTRKPPMHMPSKLLDHHSDPFSKLPFHDPPHPNNPNNYINPFNDRYQPPPPQNPSSKTPDSTHNSNKPHHHHHHPPSHPQMPDMAGSRLPFLPFPAGPPGKDFESSFIDLDKEPNAHLLPPTLLPNPHEDPSLPVRNLAKQPPHTSSKSPIYQPNQKPQFAPSGTNKKVDEKTKVLQAFETLNKADVDVIQSLAADQYGPNFMDRLKTKSNIMKEGDYPRHRFKVEPIPIVTSTSPTPTFTAANPTRRPQVQQQDTNKLTALLNMINKKPNSDASASASTMGSHSSSSDSLSSLLQQLSKPVTAAPHPATTTRLAELPSNPGLVSLTSLHQPPAHDIKSLQAQIAKAIIAKAQRKPEPEQQPTQKSDQVSNSPISLLQQLAQNRMDLNNHGKNYTASQIDTLKKLIALNNIEQKLSKGPAKPTQADPLRKLQSLLPSPLSSVAPALAQADFIPTNSITRKMLDSTTAHSVPRHHHNHPSNNNLLQDADPTILALKAIAMSKAQGVNPQPSMKFPQQVKPTEPSSQPINVDLSAILSPSPPVVEQVSRTRRLTNVRNAPKSFYPANATQGFEDPSLPLLSDFHCDEQSFFPGLYADTELGCRVFHLCAKTEAGFMMKSFRCPKETVFDQEVLRCNWNLFVECPSSKNKYHFNKYLSQSFQFLKILGEFSANIRKSDATMTG